MKDIRGQLANSLIADEVDTTTTPEPQERLADGQARLTAALREQDRKRRSIQPKVRFSKKLSRNAPCFCGSGKKLKNCCMTATLEERHRLNNPLEGLIREHLSPSNGRADNDLAGQAASG